MVRRPTASYAAHRSRLKMGGRPEYEEEDTGSGLCDLSHSNFSLDSAPKARAARAETSYWDVIKIKSFCTAKATVDKIKHN